MGQCQKDINDLRNVLDDLEKQIQPYLSLSNAALVECSRVIVTARLKVQLYLSSYLPYGSNTESSPSSAQTERK